MARLGDPRPPIQGRRSRLAGCWVRGGDTSSDYYAGALLPDGSPCLVRARVGIDPSPERVAPYLLHQWAVYADEEVWAWGKRTTMGTRAQTARVYADEEVWAWGKGALVRPDPTDCLQDAERLVEERGVRMVGRPGGSGIGPFERGE